MLKTHYSKQSCFKGLERERTVQSVRKRGDGRNPTGKVGPVLLTQLSLGLLETKLFAKNTFYKREKHRSRNSYHVGGCFSSAMCIASIALPLVFLEWKCIRAQETKCRSARQEQIRCTFLSGEKLIEVQRRKTEMCMYPFYITTRIE